MPMPNPRPFPLALPRPILTSGLLLLAHPQNAFLAKLFLIKSTRRSLLATAMHNTHTHTQLPLPLHTHTRTIPNRMLWAWSIERPFYTANKLRSNSSGQRPFKNNKHLPSHKYDCLSQSLSVFDYMCVCVRVCSAFSFYQIRREMKLEINRKQNQKCKIQQQPQATLGHVACQVENISQVFLHM